MKAGAPGEPCAACGTSGEWPHPSCDRTIATIERLIRERNALGGLLAEASGLLKRADYAAGESRDESAGRWIREYARWHVALRAATQKGLGDGD